MLVLCALGALLVPGVAAAGPPAPEHRPPAPAGTPELVRTGPDRVTLRMRLDRPLARRFDGELLARVAVDGRIASLAAAPARRGRRGACYRTSLTPRRVELGRLYAVVLLVDGAEPVTTLVALRAPRRSDARGARPAC
ncbi:MAG TPA: hypothetical protein VHF51_09080 [Solirubrobacteraceae bacterium]|nr:hypothetical protein [Solirubrobacteraceae bacterium]